MGNIGENLQRNNVALQVEGFCISYFAAFKNVNADCLCASLLCTHNHMPRHASSARALSTKLNNDWSDHKEHTILLSRERVNKGTKRMKSLRLSPHLISSILRDFTGKTTAYKSCVTL